MNREKEVKHVENIERYKGNKENIDMKGMGNREEELEVEGIDDEEELEEKLEEEEEPEEEDIQAGAESIKVCEGACVLAVELTEHGVASSTFNMSCESAVKPELETHRVAKSVVKLELKACSGASTGSMFISSGLTEHGVASSTSNISCERAVKPKLKACSQAEAESMVAKSVKKHAVKLELKACSGASAGSMFISSGLTEHGVASSTSNMSCESVGSQAGAESM
ncbi:hypothetical protein BGX38DRAFT_1147069 [Terfezia claveryi]|nr:hypothetical protein BGX38DRAFT_1147069 [Terfezia claveryi]